MNTGARAQLLPWLSVAALVLLAACGTTVTAGGGGGAGARGAGAGSTSTHGAGGASSSGTSVSAGGSAVSGSSSGGSAAGGSGVGGSSSGAGGGSTVAGAGASPAGLALAVDTTPGQGFNDTFDVAVDGAGDILTASQVAPTLAPSALAGTLLAKYGPTGQLIWQQIVKPVEPPNPPFDFVPMAALNNIAADAAGDLVVSGGVIGAVDLGGVVLQGQSTSLGAGFVAKLDPSGAVLWSKVFPAACGRARVAAAPGGRALLACSGGPVDLGGGVLPGPFFLAAYDAAGSYLWGRSMSDTANGTGVIAADIALAPSGDWVIAGYFGGDVDFGGGVVLSGDQSGGAYNYTFVASVSGTTGDTVWARGFGDGAPMASTVPSSVFVDAQGDVVVGGYFTTSVDFGGGPLVNPGSAGNHDNDGYVVKLSGADGSYVWSMAAGGAGMQDVTGVAPTAAGGVLVAGSFDTTLTLGGQGYAAPSTGSMFLVTVSGAGQIQHVSTLGQMAPEYGAVAAAPGGAVVLGGAFQGTVDLGPPVGSLTSVMMQDGFLIALVP